MKFGIKSVAAALLAGLVLAGCGQKEESKVLKVGAIAGPETELVEVAAKVAKEKYGLTVEIVNGDVLAWEPAALFDAAFPIHSRPRSLAEALDPAVAAAEVAGAVEHVVRLVVRARVR